MAVETTLGSADVARRSEITQLLLSWGEGEKDALERLMPLVEWELRKIAQRQFAAERRSHTLQPTALVNEVYLRLVDCRRVNWQNRAHFFGAAAKIMRRLLVDHARAVATHKRGGGILTVPLTQAHGLGYERDLDLLALEMALQELQRVDPRQAEVVELRFFAGLSVEETASVLDVSSTSIKRDWRTAKLFLLRELGPGSRLPR
ncbi:MAG: sigma-70 family RNA polymerase sigma factor [Acidobacteria bacterium]|nr:sigma-70 family RNA polymerase sigma factor [Acidobacteriota bacterium]